MLRFGTPLDTATIRLNRCSERIRYTELAFCPCCHEALRKPSNVIRSSWHEDLRFPRAGVIVSIVYHPVQFCELVKEVRGSSSVWLRFMGTMLLRFRDSMFPSAFPELRFKHALPVASLTRPNVSKSFICGRS